MVISIKKLGGFIKKNLLEWKTDILNISKSLLQNIKDIYNEVKTFLTKPQFPKNDENYYKEPLFNEAKDLVGRVKNLFTDMKFTQVTAIFDRIKNFPQVFKKFVAELKEFVQL